MPPPSDKEPDLNLDDVHVIAPRGITSTASEDTSLETQSLEQAQLRVEVEKLRAALDSFKQDVRQRKTFAPKLYLLTCCWLVSVMVILLIQGFSEGRYHFFRLNDSVLIALLGTTTVNVVGLFYVVAKYLFPEKSDRFDRASEVKLD
jgi:hypothetical protein